MEDPGHPSAAVAGAGERRRGQGRGVHRGKEGGREEVVEAGGDLQSDLYRDPRAQEGFLLQLPGDREELRRLQRALHH